jgi:phosphoglycolate phosphatase-like HAD superfamily hydrolase
MRPRVAAVAFDLDGTLIDTMHMAPTVYASAIRELGGPEVSAEDVTRVWHMGPTERVLKHFLRRDPTSDDLEVYFAAFTTAFEEVEPFNGIATLLDELHDAGFPVGVFTTATRRASSTLLRSAGLRERIDVLVAGDDGVQPKPNPEGLGRIGLALGTPAPALAYVGDAAIDLACATAANAVGVLAVWGLHVSPEPAPPYIASEPGDVLRIVAGTG